MKKYLFHLHDLHNKLSILYGLLELSRSGYTITEDRIDAIKSRISEIVENLQTEFKLETSEGICLTRLNQLEFCDFINSVTSKLKKIFYDITIISPSTQETWSNKHLINVEKERLYQAIENAVENSFKAKATEIEFRLLEKQNQIILELCDNGKGVVDLEEANVDKPMTEACGLNIIKDNIKRMGGRTLYSKNSESGVTVSFIFSPLKVSLPAQ